LINIGYLRYASNKTSTLLATNKDIFFTGSNELTLLLLSAIISWILTTNFSMKIGIYFQLIFGLLYTSECLNFTTPDIIQSSLLYFTTGILVLNSFLLSNSKIKNYIKYLLNLLFFVAIALIPISLLYYNNVFNSRIDKDLIYALFQTNKHEMKELLIEHGSIELGILYSVAVLFIIYLTKFKVEYSNNELLKYSFIKVVLLTTLLILSHSQTTTSRFILDKYKSYNLELETLNQKIEERKNSKQIKVKTKSEKDETYVIVLGESLNKNHMSLYGYFRNTNPRLTKALNQNNSVIIENAYSCHTHTMPTLSYALTEANQNNNIKFSEATTILEILKSADIETYWISNQPLLGKWDNAIGAIAHTADHTISLNKSLGETNETQKFDEAVIPELAKAIKASTNKSKVIFIHLMGNHALYSSRYPVEDYNFYTSDLKTKEFGKTAKSKPDLINHYDNSVLYNDFVISKLIETLDSADPNLLLYTSDHADDVIRRRYHNSQRFTYEMTEIPLLIHYNKAYSERYENKIKNLKINKNKLFCNDIFLELILGLTNIENQNYKSDLNLCSENYSGAPEKAYTLHNKVAYTAEDNKNYHQVKNIAFLDSLDLLKTVIPHRVNTIGKLSEILYKGFRSFETDIYIDKTRKDLLVGHDLKKLGASLSELLELTQSYGAEKIWLDIKNLGNENSDILLDILQNLNEQYSIKENILIETNADGDFLKLITKNGWKTSYYLPYDKITELESYTEKEKFSKDLNILINNSNFSAISYDFSLDEYVKQYLLPKISNNLVTHCWFGPAFSSPTFQSDITQQINTLGNRNKTILCHYNSLFHY